VLQPLHRAGLNGPPHARVEVVWRATAHAQDGLAPLGELYPEPASLDSAFPIACTLQRMSASGSAPHGDTAVESAAAVQSAVGVDSGAESKFVDLTVAEERDLARRVGTAWKELRRGAAMATVRDYFYGADDDALEPGQMDTLDLLVQRQGWRMSELAEALRVDPSTATRAVQRLVRTGLAERRPAPDDGRVVVVSVTPAGQRRHAAVARRRWRSLARMLAEFEPDERRMLAELLDRLVLALDHLAADLPDG
jgi:DNA-binding MarR family transcriptional regulator